MQKPKDINPGWWKKNKPKSLPKAPVDALIVKYAKSSKKDKMGKIESLVTKETDLSKLNKDPVFTEGKVLLAELKRFRNIVMKEKHKEFLDSIDIMIDILRSDIKEIDAFAQKKFDDHKEAKIKEKGAKNKKDRAKIDEEILKSRKEYAKFNADNIHAHVKKLDKEDKTLKDQVTRELSKLSRAVGKAKQEDEFKRAFGQYRWLLSWIKARISSMKKEVADLSKIMEKAGGSDADVKKYFEQAFDRNILSHTLKSWDVYKKQCQDADKAAVKQVVAKLGKKEGIACYNAADSLELPIKKPDAEGTVKLKIKKLK